MLVSDIEIFLKKKKKKRGASMIVNDIRIFQKMKNKNRLSIYKFFDLY